MASKKQIKVTLVRSINNVLPNHKACAKGLGLRRMHQTVILQDTPCIRGMVNKIDYLLLVEEVA
jgi:large subunit ribosomal protein L30